MGCFWGFGASILHILWCLGTGHFVEFGLKFISNNVAIIKAYTLRTLFQKPAGIAWIRSSSSGPTTKSILRRCDPSPARNDSLKGFWSTGILFPLVRLNMGYMGIFL